MVRETQSSLKKTVLSFPFVISLLVHLVMFLVLSNVGLKKDVRRLYVKPLSIAVLYKTPHAVRMRETNSQKTPGFKNGKVEKPEKIPGRKLVRREVKRYLKATRTKFVFQELQAPEEKNVKKRDINVQTHEDRMYKRKFEYITSKKVMTVKGLSNSEKLKRRFYAKPKIKMRTIRAKLPEEFFIRYADNMIGKAPEGEESIEEGETVSAKTAGLRKPEYPRYSRIHGEEGSVVISFEISTNGKVRKIEIMRSSGYGRLDRTAVLALNEVDFIPAKLNGKAVPSKKEIAFTFKLE